MPNNDNIQQETTLNSKFYKLTGLTWNLEELLENVDEEDKLKFAKTLIWYIPTGVLFSNDTPLAKVKDEFISDICEELNIDENSIIDDIKEKEPTIETYTAEEAAAYNLALTDAWQYGKVKTEAVAAIEGEHYTQEEISNAQEGDPAYGKTTDDWKVEPVAAVEEVLYTNAEVDEHNATLQGAVHAGDPKPQS